MDNRAQGRLQNSMTISVIVNSGIIHSRSTPLMHDNLNSKIIETKFIAVLVIYPVFSIEDQA